ncbi:MAG: radical SAM family heme chaperone HemW [Fimbriimonadaceae bacterium]|nr:radical SAM family heme chaperone HemW [Fimbriimonadaceae bacterium]
MEPINHDPVAVYIHTPFCPSKCGYCDFNSYAMQGDIMARTTAATIAEITNSTNRGRPAKTIFIGGGTPTYLPTEQLVAILEAVIEAHPPTEDCEITSEANPGTIDFPKFEAMRKAGFNRLSLGAQSFQADDLVRLGRVHAPTHIAQAVAKAKAAGFTSINIDLMFALPGQSPRAWQNNLETALSLGTQHLSLYCLTIEPNTRFYRHHTKGMLNLPDDEAQTQMYSKAIEVTESAGLSQYEISNFALPGNESRHNLAYWRNEEYLAYGPGAVGCYYTAQGKYRYTNLKHPEGYSTAIEDNKSLHCESEFLTESDQNFEKLMLGLRLNEGLPTTGLNLDTQGLEKSISRSWIKLDNDRLYLTQTGQHFCSEVTLLLAPAD